MYWFGYLRPVNTARNPGKARISTLAAYGSAPDKKNYGGMTSAAIST